MSVRVSQAQSSGTLTSAYSLPKPSPTSSRGGEDSSSGAEGRQRRRLQNTPPDNMSRSNSSLKSSLKEPPSPQKPPRSAGRDRKPTLAVKSSGSKACASAAVNVKGFLQPPEPSSNVTTFYAFGHNSNIDPTENYEFTPSVNLEDVHREIVTDDPELSQFSAPGRGGLGASIYNMSSVSSMNPAQTSQTSLIRRPSITTKYGSLADQPQQRNRRQSHVTTTAASLRKASIGEDLAAKAAQRRRPSIASSTSSLTPPILQKEPFSGMVGVRNAQDARIQAAANRAGKSKSMQPPPRPQVTTSTPLKPALTPEHARPTSFAPPKSPKSPSVKLSHHKTSLPTPGTTRRVSVIPHASGLGARTISPTDARRMKRLSHMRTPPPPNHGLDASRSPSGASSLIPRKSATPSSSGNTPEPGRKAFGSGLSPASGTSSARTSTGSLQPRPSHGLSLSKLPTAKFTRQSAEEDIPPVPPIPKSLVSPAVINAEPATRQLGFSQEVALHVDPAMSAEAVGRRRETRRKRGMTLGVGQVSHTLEPKSSASSLNKKNLAPLRLPPLNLLPLSTPTIARVNALGNTSDSEELTPPRKRVGLKTPSTPMTASKASFFDRSSQEEPLSLHQRSTSSINHMPRSTPSSASCRAGSSLSSNIQISTSNRKGRQTISPYISSSLPKQTIDFSTSTPGPDVKSAKMLGLSLPRDKPKSKQRDSNEGGEKTPDTPQSASSLRRKLSLSWKRGTKTSHAAAERESEYQPSKYDGMPPPRLPTSTTWGGQAVSTPSPSKVGHSRRKSIANAPGHDRTKSETTWSNSSTSSVQKESLGSADKTDGVSTPHNHQYQAYKPPALNQSTAKQSNSTSSILGPVQKILSNKSSLGQIRRQQAPQDPSLDADDLMAEEEMRKLASKRKNLDQLATELDDLKRRAVPKEKMTPVQASRIISLNIFERGEIVDYKDVYFCGNPDAKKHIGDLNSQSGANFGYDDERGDYHIVKGDHLGYRYEIIDLLGKGSFGQVVRCIDHKTGSLVAIKIIRNKKRFHQQALVEVNILQKLREWDPHNKHSLVNFTQSFYFRGHLCISTELLGMNLYEFIKSNDFRGFSLRIIRRFTKQLLGSLVLLKSHRVIHCDLKPENVLLVHPAKGEIKVIDFGSSCFENEKVYTYIQSRFYRSPEVILGMTYGLPIDMWSLGCILAELYTGYPIFPGENEQEQLACIMEVFGPPEKHLIEKSTRKKLFFDSFGKPRLTVSSKGRRRRPSSKTLQQALKCDDEAFLDFIARCLRWDPDKRLRPDEALHHDFITGRKTPRSRGSSAQSSTTESNVKRYTGTTYSLTSSRPLPEPPTSSKKPQHASQSPVKNYGAIGGSGASVSKIVNGVGHLKRHSTVSSTASVATKRDSATQASGLPTRVTNRSASGKITTTTPPITNGRR